VGCKDLPNSSGVVAGVAAVVAGVPAVVTSVVKGVLELNKVKKNMKLH